MESLHKVWGERCVPSSSDLASNLESLNGTTSATSTERRDVAGRQSRRAPLSGLGAIAQRWLTQMAGSTDPRITQTYDSNGQPLWTVYDPITHTTTALASEQEVRIWLDQRYNQMP
ncbi:MAG: hypothetical protein KME20_16590 [Kaiparowitsia implicata GSE-PSE-MK54-09C]|jgi:hypothetical protein|nr:hypothetical protein [Kaiparowitsia implicata GSE-PSE-MK54-09C]